MAKGIFRKLYPGREDWIIRSDYENSTPYKYGEFRGSWDSKDVQRPKGFILIDICKGRGPKRKARLISKIIFMQDERHRLDFPLMWETTLRGKANKIIPEWTGVKQTADTAKNKDWIEIQLTKPTLVGLIKIQILEPRLNNDGSPKPWVFNDLEITEIRFSWNPTIGQPSYPSLRLYHLFDPVLGCLPRLLRRLLLTLREGIIYDSQRK